MTIEVKLIADSMTTEGKRIITVQCHYPLIIHAQVMTHRVFSRNAASNRAIPVKTLLKRTLKDMAMPISYGSNKPGMQAGEEMPGYKKFLLRTVRRTAGLFACSFAYLEQLIGIHKQHANRLMMPFQHIDTIITSTEWDNFFTLRIDDASQPEIQELARQIKAAMDNSSPKMLQEGEWHLPYITSDDLNLYSLAELKKISAARCARVSYLNHDQSKPNAKKDLALADTLAAEMHLSPFEHQATPKKGKHANFIGWLQFRSEIDKG